MVVALKKSDLYSSLWKSADELRGGMDASQYKDYVLTLLFVKYVSDKAKSDPYSLIEVPEGGSFDDLVTLRSEERRVGKEGRVSRGRGHNKKRNKKDREEGVGGGSWGGG